MMSMIQTKWTRCAVAAAVIRGLGSPEFISDDGSNGSRLIGANPPPGGNITVIRCHLAPAVERHRRSACGRLFREDLGIFQCVVCSVQVQLQLPNVLLADSAWVGSREHLLSGTSR